MIRTLVGKLVDRLIGSRVGRQAGRYKLAGRQVGSGLRFFFTTEAQRSLYTSKSIVLHTQFLKP
jgi:hypothetical protein